MSINKRTLILCSLDDLRSSIVIPLTFTWPILGKFSNKGFVLTTNLNASMSISVRRKGVEFGHLEESRSKVTVRMGFFLGKFLENH